MLKITVYWLYSSMALGNNSGFVYIEVLLKNYYIVFYASLCFETYFIVTIWLHFM